MCRPGYCFGPIRRQILLRQLFRDFFSGGRQDFGDAHLPQVEMSQDTANQLALADEADDLHLATTFGAFQRIKFPNFIDAFLPGL